jgi:peptidoglycan/LPS O-acetylase OafA/YrhL
MDIVNPVHAKRKLLSLDYMRGIAILLVAMGHFFDLNPTPYEYLNVIRMAVSFVGIPLFFVLSGFLLTRQMTLYREKYTNIRQRKLWSIFFLNRVLRIYPAYLVSLALLWILSAYPVFNFFVLGLNIHNFFPQYIFSVNPVYWTLAIEFQWYLAFPLIFTLFSRMGKRFSYLVILFFTGLFAFLWRQNLIYRFNSGIINFDQLFLLGHGQLISHLFAFGLGITLFYMYVEQKHTGRAHLGPGYILTGIVLCLAGGFLTVWGLESPSEIYGLHLNSGTLFFLPLGASFLLYWALMNERVFDGPKKYFIRFISWIGIISYSLYLWHYPVFFRLKGISDFLALNFLISFSAAIALSWISYVFVEKYFLNLKRIFLGRISYVGKLNH